MAVFFSRLRLGRAALVGLVALIALLPLAPVQVVAANPDKVDQAVRHVAAKDPTKSLPVLITRTSTSAALNTLAAHGAKIRHQLAIGNIVAASILPADLDAIAADPGVVRVAYDAPMNSQTSSGPDPLTLSSQLQSVYPIAVQAAQAWHASTPLIGTGVGIAVLDSGLDATNRDMWGAVYNTSNSRVVYQAGMIQQASGGSTDDYGHGTWVSGIAAGRGWGWDTNPTEGNYIGIAPDANLIELKVSDINGQAQTSDVVNAIEWVTNNAATYNIRVINLSLVSSVAESYTTSALDAAVELAWLKGIVVVVSAGNSGANTELYAPANDPYVITVGATDDHGTASTSDDQLTTWSSYGTTQDGFSKPDLVAPGRHIVGPLAGGNVTLASEFPNNILQNIHNLYIQLSGTSAAAPVVTGSVADLLQTRPNLRPDDVKGLLQQTALPIPGVGTGAGYPQIISAANFTGAINRANVGLVPNNYVAQAGCQTLPSGTNCAQANWSNVSWNSVSWNSVSWNSVSWNSVSWNSVSWNSVNPASVN